MNLKELEYRDILALKNKEWKPFGIGALFEIKKENALIHLFLMMAIFHMWGETNRIMVS